MFDGRLRDGAPSPWRGSMVAGLRLPVRLLTIAAVLLLTACASAPRRDVAGWQAPGATPPDSVTAFRLSGRLAVSDGRDGGSAGFVWTQQGDRFEVELRQPVSQRTWRLHGGPRSAVLEGAEDGPRHGPSAEALLLDVLGWHVPVSALRDWVRGLPHGQGADIERDAEGRAVSIVEDGWQVDYREWLEAGAWPTRVVARRAPYSVRLSVHDWWVADDRR